MMPQHIGEIAAMGTAVLWTLSALAWTSAGKHVGALAVSFVRLAITIPLLMVYGQLVRGQCLPADVDAHTWLVLGLSGIMGLFVSDLCLFKAMLLIGPRLSLLVYSLTPPLTALLAWSFFAEPLRGWQWIAMLITLAGIVWVVLEEPEADQRRQPKTHASRGVFFAAAAAATQGVGAVLSQQGLGDYDAGAATLIRVIVATAGYLFLITVLGRWPIMAAAVRHVRAMAILTLGAVTGPFLGLVLYMVALRHCPAGVVATITSTMPVLILPLSILVYGEKVSWRAAGGAAVSVAGIALLMLT